MATVAHSTAPVARPGFDARWNRVYRLHAVQIPAMRAVSFILLTLLLGFYNSRVNPQLPFAITLRYAVLAVTYISVSWFILHLHYLRPRARHRALLALFFTLLDPFVIAGAVYWSGADRSWLFVLILIPIVSQSYFSGTRAIAVGVSSACAYLAMLAYANGPISWAVASAKVAVIAGATIYCIWVGYIEERYRSSMIKALRNAKDETERLYTIAGAMAESLELETVLNEILRQVAKFIDFDTGAVQMVENDDAVRVLAVRNLPPSEVGRVRPSGAFHARASIDRSPDCTTLRVPLVVRDRVIGALMLEAHRPNAYGDREADAVMAVAQHAAVALDHARLYRAERELAVSDPLTGIANRRRFEELLKASWEKAFHEHTSLAALMIDVDAFKAYNDRYGHQKGDDVLRAVATQLRVHANGHLVARYGGEEFVVVATGCARAEAAALAETFRAGVESLQIPHEGSPARVVTLSIGVAAMVPADESADPLIARADALLYQAKRAGRNRVVT